MIKDRNKGISNITYNYLNLPTQIEFEGTNDKITYLYNSVGQKLKKTVVYSDSIKIVDYLDGFQYAGGELNFFPHPEGYVSVKRGGRTAPDGSQGYVFNYVYNYTDHLGNVRVSYSKDPQTQQLKILAENHYYPFGLKHSVYAVGRLRDFEVDFSDSEEEKVFLTPVTKTEYQYKYNGQEWQDELGLNMYAMDLRQYDPAIARWVAQDPVTHFEYSPYNAFDNNPVFWADPSGADAVDIGYDRIVDSQDLMGSYHWSGGFQEIENEGGDDIIFKNNKGEEIGRIVLPGENVYVNVDTETAPPSPIVVKPIEASEELGKELDAIGINFEASGVIGGGPHYGVNFTYFLNGKDAGNLYVFRYFGGGTGLEGEIGAFAVGSVFNRQADPEFFNAKGMEGKYSGYSGGFYIGGSYSWSNEENKPVLYPGAKGTTTTWENYSIGGGYGNRFGAKVYWGNSTLLNNGKPLNTN